MIVYRLNFDSDTYRGWERQEEEGEDLPKLFKTDEPILPLTRPFDVVWEPYGKRRKPCDLVQVCTTGCVGVNTGGLPFFQTLAPDCCELVPASLDGKHDVHLAHVFSVDAFPAGHSFSHSSMVGDFATKIDWRAIGSRRLFRQRLVREDGVSVPGVYLYATEEFKEQYEQLGLTGLEFQLYWPFKERMHLLWEVIRNRAAAEERGRLMEGNDGASSMPKGRTRKPKRTWRKNQQPTPEQLAGYLWQSIMDERMNGEWLGDAVGVSESDALGITKLAAEAVQTLLKGGADRNVLCHLARAICFESISRMCATLDETGVSWPDDEPDWQALRMALVQEATPGKKDGALGGWPPA